MIGIVVDKLHYQNTQKEEVEWQLYSQFTVSWNVPAGMLANFFPNIRACLVAWQVGWTIGTMLRGAYLKTDAGQQFEESFQGWLTNLKCRAEWINEYSAMDNKIAQLANEGFISQLEAAVAFRKSPMLCA